MQSPSESDPSNLNDSESAEDAATSAARRKRLGIALPFIGLLLWFAYLWFVSGVVPMVEKYDDGQPKVLGYMKREGLSTYRKTGHWVTYYPDGAKASEGDFERGEKVEDTWTYWDASGAEIDSPTDEALGEAAASGG